MTETSSRKIAVIFADGSRQNIDIYTEEMIDGESMLYRISLRQDGKLKMAESKENLFDALRKLRIEFERSDVRLYCFGASENVYPSPMQESMGSAVLAYKTYLGKQAYSKDIVNIFDVDDSVNPSTVKEQEFFHKKWLDSLL